MGLSMTKKCRPLVSISKPVCHPLDYVQGLPPIDPKPMAHQEWGVLLMLAQAQVLLLAVSMSALSVALSVSALQGARLQAVGRHH
jgi:hypothetical protein